MLSIVLFSLFIQITLVILAIGVGRFISDRSFKLDSELIYLRIGCYFFLGLAFLIVFTRVGTFLSGHADLSCFASILISMMASLFSFSKTKNDLKDVFLGARPLSLAIIFLIIPLILLIYWLPPEDLGANPFSSIGSLHASRYAWIANSIYENNDILIFSQNTAQSILVFISISLSSKTPYLYLFLWLYSALFFLCIFIYGLLCKLMGSSRRGILGLIIFMMGNSALSLGHVLVIDSGSPFLLNGYTDTILGIFSIIYLLFVNENLNNNNGRVNIFIATSLVLILNFLCSPQNIIFIALIPIFQFFKWKTKEINHKNAIKFWIFALVFSFLTAIPLGGMFTPKSLLSIVSYPGIMSPVGTGLRFGLQIYPGVPFYFGWIGNWEPGMQPLITFAKEYHSGNLTLGNFLNNAVWGLEQIYVTSFRVLFFKIIGILYIAYKFKPPVFSMNSNRQTLTFNTIGTYGVIFFLAGLIPACFFMLNGYKWELSRFLIPGIAIGSLGLSLAAMALADKDFHYKKIAKLIFFIFVLGGPFANFFATVIVNSIYLLSDDRYKVHFAEFLGSGPALSW